MANNKNTTNAGNVEFVVEEARTVPDGAHTGTIEKAEIVRRGEEGFQYLDVHVRESASDVVIKAGFAASRISPETSLGRLLKRFGAPVEVGQKISPVQVLKPGTRVEFDTESERNKNGTFARVILDTLRPAK